MCVHACMCFCCTVPVLHPIVQLLCLQLRQVQAERDALAAKLDALTEEHSRVLSQQQERTEVVGENDDRNQTTSTRDDDDPSSIGVLTWDQLTPQSFVELHNNFNALQVRL